MELKMGRFVMMQYILFHLGSALYFCSKQQILLLCQQPKSRQQVFQVKTSLQQKQ